MPSPWPPIKPTNATRTQADHHRRCPGKKSRDIRLVAAERIASEPDTEDCGDQKGGDREHSPYSKRTVAQLLDRQCPVHNALYFSTLPRTTRRVINRSTISQSVCALTKSFPCSFGFLTDQLTRAAVSIATNLAEGYGRFTQRDRRHFFGIARGSAQECVPLLELSRRRLLLNNAEHARLSAQLQEIARMLSALVTAVENRKEMSGRERA